MSDKSNASALARANWKVAKEKVFKIVKGAYKIDGQSERALSLFRKCYPEHMDPKHQYHYFHADNEEKWKKSNFKSYSEWLKEYRASNMTSDEYGFVAYIKDKPFRENTLADIVDGKLIFKHSFPKEWQDKIKNNPGVTEVIYVMDRNYNMYVGMKEVTEYGKIHHSSFLNGRPARMAGCMEIDNKFNVKCISNYSGHYTPGPAHLYDFINYLKEKKKIHLDKVNIHCFSEKESITTASDFLNERSKSKDSSKDELKKAAEAIWWPGI